MVKKCEIIKTRKRINRRRGGEHYGEVGDTSFSLEHEHCFSLEHEHCSSDDVLIEILALLPLKSIFRFKCVSKRWLGLISTDYLRLKVIERNRTGPIPVYFFQTPHLYLAVTKEEIREHFKKYNRERAWSFLTEAKSLTNFTCCPDDDDDESSSNYKRLLFDKKTRSEYKFGETLKVDSDLINRRIGGGGDNFRLFICCSNGLLLCLASRWIKSPRPPPGTCSCDTYRLFYKHVTRYYIYNPLTKVGYLLPYSPKQSQRQPRSHVVVGQVCSTIWRDCVALVVGMGSSSSSSSDHGDYDGYKVVRAEASLSNKNIIELETFSSHTGKWQLSTVTVAVPIHGIFSYQARRNRSVCVIKGAIYWMVEFHRFEYILAYYPPNKDNPPDADADADADADVDAAEEEKEKEKEQEKENHPGGGGGGVIKIIFPPRDGNNPLVRVGMGESVDGLLQLAALRKSNGVGGGGGGGGGDYVIKIWVYKPRVQGKVCRWFVRRRLPLKPNIEFQLDFEHQGIFFHPRNPNILFISSNGRNFACHLNITPVFVEPLAKINLMHQYVAIQPYLPPLWPISPFPAAAQKK